MTQEPADSWPVTVAISKKGWGRREWALASLSFIFVHSPGLNINREIGIKTVVEWKEEGKERKEEQLQRKGMEQEELNSKSQERLIILGRPDFELWAQEDVIE